MSEGYEGYGGKPGGPVGGLRRHRHPYDSAFPHKAGRSTPVRRHPAPWGAGSRILDVACRTGLPTHRQLTEVAVGAVPDDVGIPFPGHTFRVSGFLRHELRRVVCGTGFKIAGENPYAYAPESNAAALEHQRFLNCRRT